MGAALAALFLAGCVVPLDIEIDGDGHHDQIRGNGYVVSEFRAVHGYHTIVAGGAASVVVTKSGYEGVEIQAEENLLRYLEAGVRDGVLYLGTRNGVSLSPSREIVFYVDAAELEEMSVSGAVDAELDLGFEPNLYLTLSGAASLEAWGETRDLDVRASGAARYHGLDLESARADVVTSGASGAFVWATERLDADASGASFIRYVGNPVVHATTSGAGSIGRY